MVHPKISTGAELQKPGPRRKNTGLPHHLCLSCLCSQVSPNAASHAVRQPQYRHAHMLSAPMQTTSHAVSPSADNLICCQWAPVQTPSHAVSQPQFRQPHMLTSPVQTTSYAVSPNADLACSQSAPMKTPSHAVSPSADTLTCCPILQSFTLIHDFFLTLPWFVFSSISFQSFPTRPFLLCFLHCFSMSYVRTRMSVGFIFWLSPLTRLCVYLAMYFFWIWSYTVTLSKLPEFGRRSDRNTDYMPVMCQVLC